MITEIPYRLAFVILLMLLVGMRIYFMVRVRRAGERIMPDHRAINREGGLGFFIMRIAAFFGLMALLGMYVAGMAWMDVFIFKLPALVRWTGFTLGILSVTFMTWTQVTLDTRWSAQLQLRENHHLITTGPFSRIRHPLYASLFGWGISLSLLTANWIFIAVSVLAFIGLILRIPKEEQMMIDAFGEDYKTYMQHTGRFFPKWR